MLKHHLEEHQIERAFHILHDLALENRGWKSFFRRWYISDEPLRNGAATLLREVGYREPMPIGTQLVGDDQ